MGRTSVPSALKGAGRQPSNVRETAGARWMDRPPRRAYVRKNAGDSVEPEVSQVLDDPFAEQVSHAEF
uniref:Uncharacterized protein n=1 Tax=Solanum tuberosum TaxID=4113 RepID=M1DUN3_SOLTU